MNKPIRIRLHILTPVNIGCGDVYEPTSFVIDGGRLILFSQSEFINNLDDSGKNELIKIADKATIESIIEIYGFIYKNKSIIHKLKTNHKVEISEDVIKKYNKMQKDEGDRIKDTLNKLQIFRTSYTPGDNIPYIPGSSLKGGLRTAYLSELAVAEKIKNWPNKHKGKDNAKKLEKKLLNGDFATDPFRMVKVSDLRPFDSMKAVKTKIIYAVNIKKEDASKAKGPYQILETIQPGSVFEGTVNIDIPLSDDIKKPIRNIEELLSPCHKFYYVKILDDDIKNMEKGKIGTDFKERIDEKFKDRLGKSAFLVRIGRHSGAEALTIEGNRSIKSNNDYEDHATTFWFASEDSNPRDNGKLVPFGWAILEVLQDTERPEAAKAEHIEWKDANVVWNAGNRTLTTTSKDGKRALKKLEVNNDSFVPEIHRNKMFNKPKHITTTVFVEKDGNQYKLIKMEG